jgi:2-phospho-L-lactate guanylyltransferase
MPIWAIVPVKPFREAKSRLASILSVDERAKLGRDFLSHTLDVLAQVPAITRSLVISRDTAALQLARKQGAFTVTESGTPELNAALARATDVSLSFGADAVLVLPSDLPLVTADDVQTFIQLAPASPGIVIAPDRHEEGTNAILARPPRVIPYLYGERSYARHLRAAQERQLSVAVCRLNSFGLDVDVPEDLELYRSQVVTRSGQVVR